MKRVNVYLPDHVRQALTPGGDATLTDTLASLIKELVASGDSSLLPQEKRMLSEAARRYHVALKVPREALRALDERAEREGVNPSTLASALIMNYALKEREVRASHASYFPQGEEVRAFVEDGDKSHLRRVAPSGREWHPSNVAQLGSAAADLLSSLGYSKEVEKALSLSADEAPVFMKSLMDKVREGAEKGRAYDQLKIDHDREVKERERLEKENEELRGKVNSLQESLQSERKAHEEEMKRKFAELNEELAKEKKSARRLRATVTKLSGELEQAKKRAKDAEDYTWSLKLALDEKDKDLKEVKNQLDSAKVALEEQKKQEVLTAMAIQNERARTKALEEEKGALTRSLEEQRAQHLAALQEAQKAESAARALADAREWAVAPLSVALQVAAKNADALDLSWDAMDAVEAAATRRLNGLYKNLPKDMDSFKLPKDLDPRYVVAYWVGLLSYASAGFVEDAAETASRDLQNITKDSDYNQVVKAMDELMGSFQALAKRFFSSAETELFSSYWSEREMTKVLGTDEIVESTTKFTNYVRAIGERTTRELEDLQAAMLYATFGKFVFEKPTPKELEALIDRLSISSPKSGDSSSSTRDGMRSATNSGMISGSGLTDSRYDLT